MKFSSGEQHDQYINELLQHDGRYIETEKVCKALLTLYDHEPTREAAVYIDTWAFDCTRMKICHDVLTGDTPRHYEGDPIGFDLMKPPEKEFRRALMGADTIDKTARPLFLGKLSSGTQGVYLWMLYLGLKIANFYHGSDWNGFQRDWKDQPAIILIDEIENHLHPLWQRRVIPALVEDFPNAQIFAATHSPFVVGGLKAGQVHRLYRNQDGILNAGQPNEEGIIGWTMDEILRGFMGVDDPTDDATARHAAELRRLRDKGPEDTGEAEERRQARMGELRRLVDRDLLAGGGRWPLNGNCLSSNSRKPWKNIVVSRS